MRQTTSASRLMMPSSTCCDDEDGERRYSLRRQLRKHGVLPSELNEASPGCRANMRSRNERDRAQPH
jgi:hypothetical protein